jgi:ankyrin repeat protein
MVGDMGRLERILDRHPEQLDSDRTPAQGGTCAMHPPTPSGYSPLIYASRAGQTEAVKLLLRRGANVNRQTREMQSTALHRAAYAGHADVVRVLLEAGADTSIRDCDGLTALERVARQRENRSSGRADVVRLLEEREKENANARGSSAIPY